MTLKKLKSKFRKLLVSSRSQQSAQHIVIIVKEQHHVDFMWCH